MAFNSGAYLGALAQGNRAMFAGITSAGNSIAGGIERSQAETKRLKAFRAMAVDGLGLDPDEVDNLDADTLQGKMEAVAIKSAMERRQREQEDQDYERAQRAAATQFQSRLTLPAGTAGPPAPLTSDRILSAAADTGYQLDPRTIAQFARENEAVNWGDVMPRPFEIDGVKGAVGKSGQFQFLPSATPDSLQAVPVLDEEGNVMDWRVPTAKGGTAALPRRTPKTLPDSYNSRLALLQDELSAAETNAGKSEAELKAAKLPGPAHFRQRADLARKSLRDHVSRFKEQGYADAAFWKSEEERLGLKNGGASVPASQPADDELVNATNPQGKPVRIRKSQVEAAKAQGYKL